MDQIKMQKWGIILLRVGFAFVFLWFGANQLMNPSMWTGFLPSWTQSMPLSGIKFVEMNGLFEIIGAILLISKVGVRFISLLLALHLVAIAWTIGFSEALAIRDMGLAIAMLSLSLIGPERASAN